MADAVKKVVNLKEFHNEGMVKFLEHMVKEAKAGNVTGFAGAFYFDIFEGEPAIGTMHSDIMQDNFYATLGALDQVKYELLVENDTYGE